MGPDQVERMEQARKLRNRAFKAAHKAGLEAIPEDERERAWQVYRKRRNRADQMIRAMRNGTPVRAVANYHGLSPDDVLAEIKWLSDNRRRSGRGTGAMPTHPKQTMSKSKRRRLRLKARRAASRKAQQAQATTEPSTSEA